MSGRIDQNVLREVFTEIVADRIDAARREAATTGGFGRMLWRSVEEGGFAAVAVPEERGGSGGTLFDLATVLRVSGHLGAPIPLAEHNVASMLLAESGAQVPAGPLTVAELKDQQVEVVTDAGGARVTGSLRSVPWAGPATGVVVTARVGGVDLLGVWTVDSTVVTVDPNLAGEPVGDVVLPADGLALTPAGESPDRAWTLLTLGRSLLITGALRRVLLLTVRYARERTQFGRQIGDFQAVGHQLAVLAGAVEQADAIVDTALEEVAAGRSATDALLAAAICTGEAAGTAIAIGHQVHGAIGVTEEHELHHHTRRLMAWRDQGGSERAAALQFGQRIAGTGPAALWRLLTDPTGASA